MTILIHHKQFLTMQITLAVLDARSLLISLREFRQISETGTIIDYIHINSTLINYALPKLIQNDVLDHMPICAKFRCKPNKKCIKRPLTQKLASKGVDLFLANQSNRLTSQELHYKPSIETLISLNE